MRGPILHLLALAALFPPAALANFKPFELWARLGYPTDMKTEWLIVEDPGEVRFNEPGSYLIHTLVEPHVTKGDRYWTIFFDPTTRKKPLLAAHFDEAQATLPQPGGFQAKPTADRQWFYVVEPPKASIWLVFRSREFWDGKFTPLNFDPDQTGKPTAYTLDPSNAVAVSFFEPVVTAQGDEWTITFPNITPEQKAHLAANSSDWFKHHPGPKIPTPPKIRYSATMQKQYAAWEKALKDWQKAGSHGTSPRLEDFFKFTPEQAQQYAAWEKARALWYATGQEPFPQPVDFVRDAPSAR